MKEFNVENLDTATLEWVTKVRDDLTANKYPDLENLASLFDDLKTKLETMKAAQTLIQKMFDSVRLNKIPDMMDEQDITTITFATLGRLTLTSDIRASIPKSYRKKAYEWMELHGHGDLIVEGIPSSTLKAFCKRLIKKGEILPDDLFVVSPFSRASLTKVKR